jgi:hypothetical protein
MALAACTIEDGPVYDVPAREQAHSLSLEIDKDGAPLILAQTNMYFTTAGKRGKWDPLYNSINTQTLVFSKPGGKWQSHPFKNLGHPWGYSPKWARNELGALQPLVWDRERLNLYAGAVAGWGLQIRRTFAEPGAFWSFGDAPHFGISSEGGWHRLNIDPRTGNLIVMDENGISARLDSAFTVYPMEFLQGKDWLGVLARADAFSGTGDTASLAWYRWNRDLAHPAPTKTILAGLTRSTATVMSRVKDEWRILAFMEGDNLAEWAVHGDRFERIAGRAWPWSTPDSSGDPAPTGIANGTLMSDALGCLHDFTAIMPPIDTGRTPGMPGMPSILHRTSCGPERDTLDFKRLAGGKDEMIVGQNTRVAPDGSAYIAVVVQEQKQDYIGDMAWANRPVLPSRIMFAGKRPGGKWVYETVVSY